ncbi:MAG: Tad domain-containing protein [Acidimicrobiia bacterium]|nr:Tad domain-containing protein [Acidimicrobiia bacterium]
MNRRTSPTRDDGAVLLTVTISVITLMAVAALVLDLAAVRLNRSVSQTLADSAATAGALDTEGNDGRAGCVTAFDYLELNVPGGEPFSGDNCLMLPTTCDSSTASVSTTGTAGPWSATVTYPVPDASPMMQPSTISDPGQTVHSDDGDQCDRFAVSVVSVREHVFAGVIGSNNKTTEIHAVAKAASGGGADVIVNLLALERYECDTIRANGGGTIVVDPVFDSANGELIQGYIAADSDGTVGCGGKGVVNASGGGSTIRADGPSGCPGELGSYFDPVSGLDVGRGCGAIDILAPGTPGCGFPACTSSGTVAPDPGPLGGRLTRAPIDHRYNCKSSYSMPIGWDIDGCTTPAATYIDDLVSDYGGPGVPAGFTTWTSAGYKCKPKNDVVVPAGDWYINCSNFAPKKNVVFTGGDVVFEDRITLNGGTLAINGTSANPPYTPATAASVVYLRDGEFSKGGNAGFVFLRTTVYLASGADIKMTGGSAPLVWTAPTSGDFAGLALWAETGSVGSPGEIELSGGSGLDLEGIFFSPWSNIKYSGNGSQEQAAAQFVARFLEAAGGGTLVIRPSLTTAIVWPSDSTSQLIR